MPLREIDWYIFHDERELPDEFLGFSHVFFKRISLADLAGEISVVLGFDVLLQDPYKLCDLKPIWGYVFRDLLENYDFWGYSDVDVVYGDLWTGVNDFLKNGRDVLSVYSDFMSGPFALFRNRQDVNRLFMEIHDYRRILQDPRHYGMDENILREIKAGVFRKLAALLRAMKKDSFSSLTPEQVRFRYHWELKRMTMDSSRPSEMTEVLWKAEREGRVHAEFRPLMFSCRDMQRRARRHWHLTWEKGHLRDERGNEVAAFHLIDLKKSLNPIQILPERFRIGPAGVELL